MKVIKDNTKSPWKKRVTCDDCESVLELEKSDLTKVYDQREGDAWTFMCPCCTHVNWRECRSFGP